MSLQHKLTLTYMVVTLAAILLAEGVSLTLIAARPIGSLNFALVIIAAALAGLLLGAWASRPIVRRVGRALEVSQAWLRGNLSLRIADPISDDVGLLARQLDLLAEHLEQDEQDLDELRERNARLTDQVRALAVVEERNRLARELHDSVKQHLFSLAMTASAIRARFDTLQDVPDELDEMVREVETTAQAAQREMTRLIKDLRPGSLQEQGLGDALNDYTLLFGAREHVLIYLEVQGNDALLPPSLSESLYRVAQEALHNVARHARATRVDVHLRCIPEHVALTIRDNGIGFDTSQPRHGLGLANMEERMMSIGGVVTVVSQTGAGATVLAEVALPHPLGTLDFGEITGVDRNRPSPTIENWAWLGQRLVIPVGQTWPWLPVDQARLRRPLVEPGGEPLMVRRDAGFLGFGRDYVFQLGQRRAPLVQVEHSRSGYEWESGGASWALRRIRGLSGRMVLTRNGQPLAAMQYQGRLLNAWSEIVYDGRGYRLSYVKGQPGRCVLVDEVGDELLTVEDGASPQIELRRPLPLPLLVMVTMRIVDEVASTTAQAKTVEKQELV
ncbi:MAG: sensor histidine kinase [Chloroflexi bacterium]|nr:sensor histidine kinase [Chloroflexota bacterium]